MTSYYLPARPIVSRVIMAAAFILLLTATANAQLIGTFDELKEVLEKGKTVRVTIDYANCMLMANGKKAEKASQVTRGFTISSFEFFPKNAQKNNRDFLSFVSSVLNEATVGKGYAYSFLKLKLYDDGKAVITTSQVNPLTYENEASEIFEGDMYERETNGPGVFFYLVAD